MPFHGEYIAYLLGDSEFYTPLGGSEDVADRKYIDPILRALSGSTYEVRYPTGPWVQVGNRNEPLPDEGWKLHASFTPENAVQGLLAFLDLFGKDPIPFKFPRDEPSLTAMSARWWSPQQIGKCLVVYPADRERAIEWANSLSGAFSGMYGPTVLTDALVPGSSNVYYRYGGFRTNHVNPEGHGEYIFASRSADQVSTTDRRSAGLVAPSGIEPLWPKLEQRRRKGGLIRLRDYLVVRPLRVAGGGAVYKGMDSSGRSVIIKEGRPYTDWDDKGESRIDRLRLEHDALTNLAGTSAPEAIDAFDEGGHYFTVQEFVDGTPLVHMVPRYNPVFLRSRDDAADRAVSWLAMVKRLIDSLDQRLTEIRAAGWFFRDVSPDNIIVTRDLSGVRLIDFEGVRRISDFDKVSIFTDAYQSVNWREMSPEETNVFSTSRIEHTLICMRTPIYPLDASAAERTYDVASARLKRLMSNSGASVWEESRASRLADVLRQTVAAAVSSSAEVALLGDPVQYQTNPWGLEYGLSAATFLNWDGSLDNSDWYRATLDEVERADPTRVPAGLMRGSAGLALVLASNGRPSAAERLLLGHAVPASLQTDTYNLGYGAAGVGLVCLRLFNLTGDQRFADAAKKLADHTLRNRRPTPLGDRWFSQSRPTRNGLLEGSSGIALFLGRLGECLTSDVLQLAAMRAVSLDLGQVARAHEENVTLPSALGSTKYSPHFRHGLEGVAAVCLELAAMPHVGTAEREKFNVIADRVHDDLLTGVSSALGRLDGQAGVFDMHSLHVGRRSLPVDWVALSPALDFLEASLVNTRHGLAVPGSSFNRASLDWATGNVGVACALQSLARGRLLGWPLLGEDHT